VSTCWLTSDTPKWVYPLLSRQQWQNFYSSFKSIELHSDIQIGSYEVPFNGIHYVYLNSAAPHIAEIEEAVMSMVIAERLGQSMPLQSQQAVLKLNALVHMVICNQLPVLKLHQKQMELPWINSSGVRMGRVHRMHASFKWQDRCESKSILLSSHCSSLSP
jgi:hypothetical protein